MQVFILPPLPDEATELTIDFRYEILILHPRSSPGISRSEPRLTRLSFQSRSRDRVLSIPLPCTIDELRV